MKNTKTLNRRKLSGALAAAFALIFVLSLSAHNHYFSVGDGDRVSQSGEHYGHPSESCPACRLQGNVKLPDRDVSQVFVNSVSLISYDSKEFLVPVSYLSLDKPTRSPPFI